MRTAYHEQLATLTAELGEQVITDHEDIAAKSARAVEDAFVLLALQAPVAGDLRAIVWATRRSRWCSRATRIKPLASTKKMTPWTTCTTTCSRC